MLRADELLSGRVTNENGSPVSGARITLKAEGGSLFEAVSDQAGRFSMRVPDQPVRYGLTAERSGYFRLESAAVTAPSGPNEIHVVLTALREVYEKVDVSASAQVLTLDSVSPPLAVSGAEILAVPFPSSNNLKNALRIMPGVVQDAKSGIHVNGGAEEQVLFTLNGFTLNDPLTGRFESRVGAETVQSVDIVNGRLPAEFGDGAAGIVAVATSPGDDQFRSTATNFFPGVESRKGVYIGNWSPRFGLSGPIRRGKAWFSDSAAIQYDQQVLEDLPDGADRMAAWRFNNLAHAQINVTPSQIIQSGLLFNGWWAPHTGLNELTPMETTVDKRQRQWFFYARDQLYLRSGALVEFGYSANRTYAREVPQGNGWLDVTPDGYSGNAFVNATRRGGRDQWLATVVLPEFQGQGAHQIKAGIDVSRLEYRQEAHRTGLNYFREGVLKTSVVFGGPGELSLDNLQASLFIQDRWKWKNGVLLEAGARGEWDQLVGERSLSPRLGIAWMPRRLPRTKLHLGYAILYEPANLRLFTRPLDQYSLTTYYEGDGSVSRGPAAVVFTRGTGRLYRPRARNVSLGFQHELTGSADLQVNYFRRRGDRGFTYVNRLGPSQAPQENIVPPAGASVFDAIYTLGNERRDVYDSLEVTMRQTLKRQYGWLASYTRSRAVSNAVLDIEISDPLTVLNNSGPMPWDSPHRFVGWAYLPLFWKDWAIATLVEARTGFPYSIQNSALAIADVNTRRFPAFFEWNLHLERRFVLGSHRWEFRAGFNNLTDRSNPNVVNANAESTHFLEYYGGQRRALNFRIRWLGRRVKR